MLSSGEETLSEETRRLWESPSDRAEFVDRASAVVTADCVEIVKRLEEKARTQFVRFTIPGGSGKTAGKTARTLGIVGNLGGLTGNPDIRGLVSDADGAIAAVAVAFARFLSVLVPAVSPDVFLPLGQVRLPGAPDAIQLGLSPQRVVAILSILGLADKGLNLLKHGLGFFKRALPLNIRHTICY